MAVIVTALWGVNTSALVDAQARAGTAVIKTVSGQVEVQRKGDTQWVAAAAGARLGEGDQVRAHAGASSALDLPDGSILFVAENSRIVISKLEFDPQNQGRQAFFHLAVGKVRAAVSQAAISLVRARQSNFTISTPTAVAAARGTVFEVVYDATQNVMRVAVIVKDPRRAAGLVSCLSLQDRYSTVLVREGLATTAGTSGCAPPIPISLLPDANLVGTLAEPDRSRARRSLSRSVCRSFRTPARRPSSSRPMTRRARCLRRRSGWTSARRRRPQQTSSAPVTP